MSLHFSALQKVLQCIRSLSLNSQPSRWHSNSDHFCLRPSMFQLFFAGEKAQSFLIPYSHMTSEVTIEPDTTVPGVQPSLFSDSVKVLLSRAFNPAKLPGYCSHYGYGQVTKTPFCIVKLHMKTPKIHFSFRPQTCRLKKTDSVFPALQEM